MWGLFGRRRSTRRSNNRSRKSKYLIEFRFHGYTKKAIKELQGTLGEEFGAQLGRRKEVPHITLVGPCFTTDRKRLIKEVENVAKKYDTPPSFKLNDFGTFPGRAIFVNIAPSKELVEMRNELVKRLEKFCKLKDHDHGEYAAHATLLLNTHFRRGTDIRRKFASIMEYLNSWKIPEIENKVLRITVLGGDSRIVCEYDILLKKMLDRKDALNRDIMRETIASLKDGHQDTERKARRPEAVEDDHPGRVFIVSDLHFDHKNIIKYCNRPFRSVNEMNRAMLANWNKRVRNGDKVYYLGDMTFGRRSRPTDFWLSKLNGKIQFIRGNHDTDIITKAEVIKNNFLIRYKGHDLLLMHDPYRPASYDGWIIHGDKHNNSPEKFPHVHCKNKTINICAEYTKYAPMSLDEIISTIKKCVHRPVSLWPDDEFD